MKTVLPFYLLKGSQKEKYFKCFYVLLLTYNIGDSSLAATFYRMVLSDLIGEKYYLEPSSSVDTN